MPPQVQQNVTRDCAIFVVVHLALAVVFAVAGPQSLENVPRPFQLWGLGVQAILPSVQSLSGVTQFKTQAWFTLVAMWSLLPISAWWVARGNWVMPNPNLGLMRRRPWILILLAVIFVGLAVFFAMFEPTLPQETYSQGGRTLRATVRSPVSFGIRMGLLFSALAIGLGALPQLFRLYRKVTAVDAP